VDLVTVCVGVEAAVLVVVWALGLPVAELTDFEDDPPHDASASEQRTASTQIRGGGMW
jgi:hypothetical protein